MRPRIARAQAAHPPTATRPGLICSAEAAVFVSGHGPSLCHKCGEVRDWDLTRDGHRLRCVGCRGVFPCRGTGCKHVDCAAVRALWAEQSALTDADVERIARELLGAIRENVDALGRGEIDGETFHAGQRSRWDAVARAGIRVDDRVCELMRADLPAVSRAS